MAPQYTEYDISQALEAVANGQSVRKASAEWGVPRMTLFNRLHGHECRKDAFSPLQRLSQTQENRLTEWVLLQDALGLPPHTRDHVPLGKHWMQAFLRRNPAIRTQKCHQEDSARVNGASTDNNFSLPDIQAIKPEHRYNMDEAGIMEGLVENGLVVRNAEKRSVQRKTPGSRVWTSFIECVSATVVSATGNSLRQRTVGSQTRPQWNGWRRCSSRGPSHPTLRSEDCSYWTATGIHLLVLPPHTSHVLQPLDLSVFSPLKHYYRKQVGFLSLLTDSSPVGKQNFLSCYQRAREQALTTSITKGDWKATGLWPVSVAKPLLSPLLLENSNKRKKDAKNTPETSRGPFSASGWQSDASQIAWSTPRRPQDLKVQVLQFNQLDDDVPTKRLLFRKITKGFDEKDGLLAKAQLQIQALETQLAAVKPKKRKRVETNPNSRFADIEAVRRAQAEVIAAENEVLDETEDELSEIGDDCIVVAVGGW
ncbi:transposase [Purpureocillium lilacinum]|uniref:Transposase n=1 Tax=Purpureocillium lilacinum TaxID=33203 RepID=A0A179F7H2_PURLI|nr:transposase [Purpureocillium lilacinum]OAQ61378.1 transposase [Purpureocillium lilacinum]